MSHPRPTDRSRVDLVPFGPRASRTEFKTPLPVPLTPLVGREAELEAVAALLRRAEVRLLTLTGPGGVGKTRLAIELAAQVADAFASSVCFVALAPILDPALVVSAVADALDVREGGDRPLVERLHAYLRTKELLLVLDNFEHVIDAAPLVTELIAGCPGLTALVTSRAALRVSGERSFLVPPLPEESAVRLFVDRAEAAKVDFEVTEANGVVAEICRKLDGLPLAIELAAARANVLSPHAMLVRLERRLPLLTGGARDQPTRQQTMRDAVAWSHDLLSPQEQVLFRRLAVFVGGFPLDAAEAAGQAVDDPGIDCLDGVASLVDKSLLRPLPGPVQEEARFEMLETIREFALERLSESGEELAVRRAHATYFVVLAERAEPRMYGVEEPAWLARLDAELANVRVALEWALGRGEAETALRLGGALMWFWFTRHAGEGRGWLERALATGAGVEPAVRAKGLVAAGVLAWSAEAADERAEPLIEEGLAIWRGLGDRRRTAQALIYLGQVASRRGDLDRTMALGEEGLALAREIGDPVMEGGSLLNQALATRGRGNLDGARALLEEALAAYRRARHRWAAAAVLGILADLARSRSDAVEAVARHAESAALYREHGDAPSELGALTMAAAAGGQFEAAARFFGAIETLRDTHGDPVAPISRADYERAVASVQAALGEPSFAAARAAGRARPVEQLIAEAEAVAAVLTAEAAGPSRAPSLAKHVPSGLSAREAEVLRLAAAGLTNAQIADRLFLSENTVRAHLHRIYRKLDLANRAAAVRFALEHGLA